MNLSVVIPAYNEEKDIRAAVMDVVTALPTAEILVVDDASNDNTPYILKELCISHPQMRVLTNTVNQGHGYSVMRGLRAARGDFILYIDADRQIDLNSPFISSAALDENFVGSDVVSGWRIHRNDKLFRKVISFCLKTTNLLFHGMYIKDANCPFKVYRKETMLPLFQDVPATYVIPIACLEVMARKRGLKATTVKTPHLPYDGIRKGFLQVPNWNAWKFFTRAFFEIIGI